MATKQIYVKESDLPVFAKAEKYGTSLANVVAEALRQYVEKKEAEEDDEGYAPIELEIGRYRPGPADTKIVRFIGKQLAKLHIESGGKNQDPLDDITQRWEVYRSKKKKFVFWKKEKRMEIVDENGEVDAFETAEYMVAESLTEEVNGSCVINKWQVPAQLVLLARRAILTQETIIELDI